jgi:hypothetical protein
VQTDTLLSSTYERENMGKSLKQLREMALNLAVPMSDLTTEIERGGNPDKDYVLIIRFDRMKKMLDFVRNNFDEDEVGVWRGAALDPEFRGIGRAPQNHYVLRSPKSPFNDNDDRIDKD